MSADLSIDRRWRQASDTSQGLRIAFAVTFSFILSLALGNPIPFLGPLFAAQFLSAQRAPLPFGKAVGLVLVVAVVGFGLQLLLAGFADHPPVILTLLGAIYCLCFFAQAVGKVGPVPFLVLVVAVMMPLLTLLDYDLGTSVLAILIGGIVEGIVWMWAAHALFPHRGASDDAAQPAFRSRSPVVRALASAAILLIAVTVCLTNDRFSTALVIPITVASLLMQFDVSRGAKAAIGLILVNVLGGALASVIFGLTTVRHPLFLLFLGVLAVSLFLGGRAALPRPSANVFAGALTIFLVVLGSGVSPLPATAADTFATRVGYIALATLYSLLMAALLWPAERDGAEARV